MEFLLRKTNRKSIQMRDGTQCSTSSVYLRTTNVHGIDFYFNLALNKQFCVGILSRKLGFQIKNRPKMAQNATVLQYGRPTTRKSHFCESWKTKMPSKCVEISLWVGRSSVEAPESLFKLLKGSGDLKNAKESTNRSWATWKRLKEALKHDHERFKTHLKPPEA